jgi:hypothetical protein
MLTLTVLAIGLASTIMQILFSLSVDRLRLLLFSLGASLMFMTQYALLGQWIGFYSSIAGSAYTLMLALAYRYPILQHRGFTIFFSAWYLVVFLAFVQWHHLQLHEMIPLVAGVANLWTLRAKNMLVIKAAMLAAGVLWLTFEYSNGMYTQMLGESFELIGNAVTLLVLLKASYAPYFDWVRMPSFAVNDGATEALLRLLGYGEHARRYAARVELQQGAEHVWLHKTSSPILN